jgi:transcriptional regulator with XRE-family HTH domain
VLLELAYIESKFSFNIMSRSLKVAKQHIDAVQQRLKLKGFRTQQEFADELEFARSTVNKFLNGKRVDANKFQECCFKLDYTVEEIAENSNEPNLCNSNQSNLQIYCFDPPDYSKDFHGRQKELKILEEEITKENILVIYGEPAIGKTYLASKFANKLAQENDYHVCWLDKQELSLDELFLQINEFLKSKEELGFITTYSLDSQDKNSVKLESKIGTLVQVLSNSNKGKYAIFIDNFNLAKCGELKPLIERFRTHGKESKLIIIDHVPDKSLGSKLTNQIGKFPLTGFLENDAINYITDHPQSKNSELKIAHEDARKIWIDTEGHPLTIENIVIWFYRFRTPIEDILKKIVDYDKQDSNELQKKLFENIAFYLNPEQKEALYRFSVFRQPVKYNAKQYLDISETIWRDLLNIGLIKPEGKDNFRIYPLIAQFWRESRAEQDMLPWHKKAGEYYYEEGENTCLVSLNRSSYLESHYHWQKSNDIEQATFVLNQLIFLIHKKERLPSEKLLNLTQWLFNLDEDVFEDKPWLLLEKGRKLEKKGNYQEAELIFQKTSQLFQSKDHDKLGYYISQYYIGKIYHHKRKTNSNSLL